MLKQFLLSSFAATALVAFAGCGSGAPAEASGEPVPADYEANQAAAQQAAQEEAMKNARRRR
ncbi:MAG: hypothetical protein ABJZ55_12315 [Fuerstiella sp.]